MTTVDGLSDAIATSIKVKLGETDYEVTQLEPNDFAEAEAFIRNDRLSAFLEQTRLIQGINLPDAVRAQTMAAILNQPVSLNEVLETSLGNIFLLYLSLKKKSPGLTFEQVKRMLGTNISLLSDLMLEITGLREKAEEVGAVPLGTSDSTSTTETSAKTFQGGANT